MIGFQILFILAGCIAAGCLAWGIDNNLTRKVSASDAVQIACVAYAVTLLHRKHEPDDVDNADLQQLTAEIDAVAKANDWDAYRKKAGIGTYTLAGFIYILPKFGALKLHRDGTRSCYVTDPAGNSVEILAANSMPVGK